MLPIGETDIHPVNVVHGCDSELEFLRKDLLAEKKYMRDLEQKILEARGKTNNSELSMRGHSKYEPTQSYGESPSEAFPRNTAPTAHVRQASHCTDGVTQNTTSHQVRFANSGEPSNNYKPSYAFYPPKYQSKSQWHVVNSSIADMKKTFKIDITNDRRDEIIFFERTCRANSIFSELDMYTILATVWPNQDIKNYWAVTKEGDECYQSLKHFLSNNTGKPKRIFRPLPNWSTVSSLNLEIEVKKYESELLEGDNLRKYFYLQLAPSHLRAKLLEIIDRDIKYFEYKAGKICDADNRLSLEQKNGCPSFRQ